MTRSKWHLLMAGAIFGAQCAPALAGQACATLSTRNVWTGYAGGGDVTLYSPFAPRDLGVGGSAADSLLLGAFDFDVGTVDLSQDGNDNFATCDCA